MTIASHAREADRLTDEEAAQERRPLDLAPMKGDWVSSTELVGGITRIRSHPEAGSLLIHATGHDGGPRPGVWGEVEATVFAAALRSTAGYAFAATFEDEQVHSHLQTYQGLGVLVVHAFHRFVDGSDRPDYFTREFYVAPDDWRPAEEGEPAVGDPAALRLSDHGPGALLGTWDGVATEITKSISTLECTLVGGELMVRAEAVGPDGPVDWGTVRAELYADAHYLDNPPAFLATFDHGYMRVHLQARPNRGVLVVGVYTEFTDDSGRPHYFIREAFRRTTPRP